MFEKDKIRNIEKLIWLLAIVFASVDLCLSKATSRGLGQKHFRSGRPRRSHFGKFDLEELTFHEKKVKKHPLRAAPPSERGSKSDVLKNTEQFLGTFRGHFSLVSQHLQGPFFDISSAESTTAPFGDTNRRDFHRISKGRCR